MKRWLIFIILLGFSLPVKAQGELDELYAQSAVLMDAESGRVLFEKNGNEIRAMASTTKIMTCILALELGEEEKILTFSREAASQPKVHLGALEGERFYVRDLLYALMLESYNDAAVAIAESVAGDTASFAKLMNEKAKEIGCENTYFITPNGLDAADENGIHGTTASDLAKIMSYCIIKSPKKEAFLEITRTYEYTFHNLEGTRIYSLQNRNSFLSMMEEAVSGKTGYTAQAGYCYVGAIESEGRSFVVALLACGWPNNKNYKWSDMKKLATYGMENFHYQEIKVDLETTNIKVLKGVEAFAETKLLTSSRSFSVLMGEEEEVEVSVSQIESLTAPAAAGMQVGEAVYSINGKILATYPIVIKEAVAKIDFLWIFKKAAQPKLLLCNPLATLFPSR